MSNNKVYGYVTERILKSLEDGVVPWQQTWVGNSLPMSLSSGKPYRGVNSLVLNIVALIEGYENNWWVTRKQCKQRGGSVRKGEKYTPVVFWTWVEKVNKETGEDESYAYLRYYRVFNVDQCDDLEYPAPKEFEAGNASLNDRAEQFIDDMPDEMPRPEFGVGIPSYAPESDRVFVPKIEQYEKTADYYGSLFHELTHATGHPKRLARFDLNGNNGNKKQYAKEELVAEIGAAMCCAVVGIEPNYENDASYVQHWLDILKEPKNVRLIVSASACAQKAVDYMSNTTFEKKE